MLCDIFLNLSGGSQMPALGLGTWMSSDDSLEKAIEVALETGYRHIDTAQAYENEEIIGKVLKRWLDSGKLKREDVFITTKLGPTSMYPDKVKDCLKASLEKLQLDYVDLYLLHFPVTIGSKHSKLYGDPNVHYTDVWKKMEEQYDAGRTKNIGISNFNIRQVENLLKNCRINPVTNQVELHVYLQQRELVDFCNQNGVAITAYSPLGCRTYNIFLETFGQAARNIRDTLTDQTVTKIAEKHSKTPAQVLLRFLLQLGVAAIPKSVTPERIKENFDVFDFSLDKMDIANLRSLDVGPKARVVDWNIFDKITEHREYPF